VRTQLASSYIALRQQLSQQLPSKSSWYHYVVKFECAVIPMLSLHLQYGSGRAASCICIRLHTEMTHSQVHPEQRWLTCSWGRPAMQLRTLSHTRGTVSRFTASL